MNLSPHLTKSILRDLLPEVHLAGGSFTKSLPSPDRIPFQKARTILQETRKEAATTTVDELLCSINAQRKPPLEKSPTGYRIWPNGYVGSLTHKGTVVLGVLEQKEETRLIGIDVELNQNEGRSLSHVVCEEETPPTIGSDVATLAAFSTKESVYKALCPVNQQGVAFKDIDIRWKRSSKIGDEGVARCPGRIEIEVQCASQGNWVISTAKSRAATDTKLRI